MKKVALSPPKWEEMRITTEEKKDRPNCQITMWSISSGRVRGSCCYLTSG